MPPPNERVPEWVIARREALVALAIWALAIAVCVGVTSAYGYNRDPNTVRFVYGWPDWVFWGIVIPWIVATLITIIFAQFFMRDHAAVRDAANQKRT